MILSDTDDDNNNNDNEDNNMNSSSLPSTSLTFEILLDQLKMSRDDNQRLKEEIENLKGKLMKK